MPSVAPPLPATVAGLTLAVVAAVAAAVTCYRHSRPQRTPYRWAQPAAVGGLTFQVVHVLEHALQVGMWMRSPSDGPWLSPWAAGTAEGLQLFCSLVSTVNASPSLGVEALHLTGNLVFLGGLSAWHLHLRGLGRGARALQVAERIQAFHVIEHIALTGSVIAFGEAIGVSTALGLIDGRALVASRVWFHFIVNAAATGFALAAAFDSWPRQATRDKRPDLAGRLG